MPSPPMRLGRIRGNGNRARHVSPASAAATLGKALLVKNTKKTSAKSASVPKIFPISLGQGVAHHLVMRCASKEWVERTSWHSDGTEYFFHAELRENGDVEVLVSYNSDRGFIRSSGPLFSKVIRPYNDKKIAELKADRMFEIAEKEFHERRKAVEREAILKIQAEIFGVAA